jgi:tRNA-specific 2-thiouridylase
MADERFEDHLRHPRGQGEVPAGAHCGVAGGAACGDLVRIAIRVEGDRVIEATFAASGCGAASAAASAAIELISGAPVLEAAKIGTRDVDAALGGLSAGKIHAAELAADALARALGGAVAANAQLDEAPGRVLIAMSGGVDSAVAAHLCAGRCDEEPVAVTLELWRDEQNDAEGSCCSASAVQRARSLAHGLGLAHLTLDLRESFRAGVVEPWIAGHAAGKTPNPCVRCNGAVRLDAMLDLASRLGARELATGHYARVGEDGLLRAAADPAKDQSYMLAALAPESVARMLFPLGEMTKPEVRLLAAEAGLSVAQTPDSQDLCFLAGTASDAFLARHGGINDRPGPIVDLEGVTVGSHNGAHGFTVGQRRGLEIGGVAEPLYVAATDAKANTVTVGRRDQLHRSEVELTDVKLYRPAECVDRARLRSHAPALECRLSGAILELKKSAWAPAPGQTAVLLSGDRVVGCATIA